MKDEAPRKKPNLLVRLLAFLLTTALVLGAVALVAYRDRIHLDALRRRIQYAALARSDSGQAEPFSYIGRTDDLLTALDGDLLVCSATGVGLYSMSGVDYLALALGPSNPTLFSDGTTAVLYEAGGTRLWVFSGREECFSLTMNEGQQLLSATLSGGRLAVTSREPGYKAVVTVYDLSFAPKMALRLSSRFLSDAILSQDGGTLVAVALGQSGDAFESSLLFYRTDGSEEPFATCSLGNTVALMLRCAKDALWVLGDNAMQVTGLDGALTGRYAFDGRYLKEASLDGDGFAALLLGKYRAGSAAELITVDGDGNQLGSLAVDEQVLDLTAAGRYVALLTADRLDIYTRDLTLYATLEGTQGARRALMRADGTVILVGATSAWLHLPD